MMDEGRRITLALVAAGVFFVLASFAINFFDGKKSGRGTYQAQALVLKEGVSLRRQGSSSFEKFIGKKDIYFSDSLVTNTVGKALLDFNDGSRLQLNPSSFVTLDYENENTVLFIQRGTLEVEKMGTGGIFIAQNGQRFPLAEYVSNNGIRETTENTSSYQGLNNKEHESKGSPTLGTSTPLPSENDSLSKNYIENTLKNNRPHFYKCFSQLLQKKPGSQGHATLQFTIERSGKVNAPEISFISIADGTFRNCLIEALKRIEFNSYKGEPITTLFPIKFE